MLVGLAWLLSCELHERPRPGCAPQGSENSALLMVDLLHNDVDGLLTRHLIPEGAAPPGCTSSVSETTAAQPHREHGLDQICCSVDDDVAQLLGKHAAQGWANICKYFTTSILRCPRLLNHRVRLLAGTVQNTLSVLPITIPPSGPLPDIGQDTPSSLHGCIGQAAAACRSAILRLREPGQILAEWTKYAQAPYAQEPLPPFPVTDLCLSNWDRYVPVHAVAAL